MQFDRVTDIDRPDFRAAIAIYEEAFPANERVSIATFEKKVTDGTYQLFVGNRDDRVIFMAILCEPILEEFVLLGYLATHAEFRSQGIGAQFFSYALSLLQPRAQYLLLEVEDPQIGVDRDLRQRRVNFYRRLGAKQLKNVRYILPLSNRGEPMEMILMLAPEYPGNRITGERFKQLITELYTKIYQRRSSDPLLRSIWQNMGAFVELV
ncbi:MAG TPA: hypothetical protein IGS31_16500 [Oscillatoriales cyanobacterium M4454_W2019_049]|nr:hypothetical protein [Oscillatoriales cyanobacterium M4454_W2019_049]